MGKYILKRIGYMVLVFLIVSFFDVPVLPAVVVFGVIVGLVIT